MAPRATPSCWCPDSLRVLRSDSAWRPATSRTGSAPLSAVARLDIARGNQWARGALGGLLAAVGVGIVVGIT